DPLHRGYQIIQSFIALGGGGFLGKGLGNSAQKLFYLPNPHTDFIFAIIGEETGFLGAGAIVFLFLWLAFWGMRIACNSKDSFGQLLGFGLISAITIQALLNMGVACGIFPITGLPLPLVSVGGSGLLFAMFSIGVILNISRASPKANSGGLACEY
ncbi:TPA: stage V sporulation protein E, partial [bacterium]|nr:stage V sporulation protein E [bacterium]